jgi:hypothetical protein
MRKRLLAILAGLALGLTGVAVTAAPAQASTADCEFGQFCVWTVAGHVGGEAYHWTVPSGSGGYCVNYGSGLNDKVDSLALKGGRSVTQYRDANCSGNTVSFHYSIPTSPWYGSCGSQAWACTWEGIGSYLPSSAWIIK